MSNDKYQYQEFWNIYNKVLDKAQEKLIKY